MSPIQNNSVSGQDHKGSPTALTVPKTWVSIAFNPLLIRLFLDHEIFYFETTWKNSRKI